MPPTLTYGYALLYVGLSVQNYQLGRLMWRL